MSKQHIYWILTPPIQGTFVQKMWKLNWLRSPGLMATVQRAIIKYHRFVGLTVDNPKQSVVPTLDVDLAWVSYCCYYVQLFTSEHLEGCLTNYTAHPPTDPKNILPIHRRGSQKIPQPRRQNPRIHPQQSIQMDLARLRAKIRPTLLRMLMLVL